jgi:RecB family exonuclease
MFPQSFSSLKTFLDCPRLYRAKYIDRSIPYEQSPAAKRGEEIHEAMRRLVEGSPTGTPPANAGKFLAMLRLGELRDRGWTVGAETELAVDRGLARAPYRDREAWLRGRLDLVLTPPGPGPVVVVDWKTGRTPGHPLQMLVASVLAAPAGAERDRVCLFAYLDLGTLDRIDVPASGGPEETVRRRMAELEDAWNAGRWPANPGGPGCRWCPEAGRCQGDLFMDYNQAAKEA